MVNSRWDGKRAATYDQKWKQMAAAGENPHGEVDFVEQFSPQSVLDAGCGTGRVALEFDRRGVQAAGTDVDAAMLSVARENGPHLDWFESDLASLALDRTFDAVVMAGNVVLFVEPGTESAVVAGAARHVAPQGRLVAGFGLGRGVTVDDWEAWVSAAGLEPVARHSTWQGDPFESTSNYLVSVAQRVES